MKRVSDPHPLHWANFLECVKTRQQPNSDIEKCFRSSATCLLGNIAYRSKLRVDWDDQTEDRRKRMRKNICTTIPQSPGNWRFEAPPGRHDRRPQDAISAAAGALESVGRAGRSFPVPMGLEIYSLRDEAEKDLPATLALIRKFGFTEVEVRDFYGRSASEFRRLLDDNGLKLTSMMAAYDRLQKRYQLGGRRCPHLGRRIRGVLDGSASQEA